MAVIIRISNLKLDPIVTIDGEKIKVKHLSTDWLLADNPTFKEKHILLKSLNDKKNLTSIRFKDKLDPNKKYYAKARALLSTGYTLWGNIDVVKVTSLDNLNVNIEIPSKVSTPIITTNSSINAHLPTFFKIMLSGYYVVGTASHVASSYYIEDLDGNVVWARERDTINKNEILVNDITLRLNHIYRIKARFHSSTKDTSQLSSYTFHVKNTNMIIVNENLNLINKNSDVNLSVNNVSIDKTSEWKLLHKKNNLNTLIWEMKTEDGNNEVVIPKGIMIDKESYILIVDTDLSEKESLISYI